MNGILDKIEPRSPASTIGMPSPWVDREDNNLAIIPSTAENWRNQFEGNYKDRMKYLLENDDTGKDVVFVVGSTKVEIKAHKFILANSSIEFKNLFEQSGEHSSTNTTIILNDEDSEAFGFLIRYIYLEEIAILDRSSVGELLRIASLAEKYQFPLLHLACVKEIQKNVESNWNLGVEILDSPHLQGNNDILASSIKVIARNISAVFESQEFLNLSQHSLRIIIGSNKLSIAEIKILEAASCWAKHQINKDEPVARSVISPLEIRSMLGNAIHDIRFPLFTLEEFLCSVTLHNLLEEADHAKILNYITRKTYNVGNPQDPQWDTWPYIKESRATPPAVMHLMGPPNTPDRVSVPTATGMPSTVSTVSNNLQMTPAGNHQTPSAVSKQINLIRWLVSTSTVKKFQRIRLWPEIHPPIWEGCLEWTRVQGTGMPATRSVSCAIHCINDTVEACNWEEKLILKFSPKLDKAVSIRHLSKCRKIAVVPTSADSMFLTTVLSKYHGIVAVPLKTNPSSVVAFVLSYCTKRKMFVGFIPNNQREFLNVCRNSRNIF